MHLDSLQVTTLARLTAKLKDFIPDDRIGVMVSVKLWLSPFIVFKNELGYPPPTYEH